MNKEINTVESSLIWGKTMLKSIGCESYALDAELIMMKVLNISRVQLIMDNKRELSTSEYKMFAYYIHKRVCGMPTKYILGECEFMSLNFIVDINTLIPRNDTEILVEKAIEIFNNNDVKNFIEIGTGTGCIPISILNYVNNKNMKCVAVDINKKTIETAIQNAKNNGVLDNINFLVSDIFEEVESGMKFDAIISNPPYIETDEIKNLMIEVKNYEPIEALDGGKDGLYFYNKIVRQSKKYLNKNGFILFEIGYNQAESVKNILINNGYSDISIIKDLAGLDRVVIGINK